MKTIVSSTVSVVFFATIITFPKVDGDCVINEKVKPNEGYQINNYVAYYSNGVKDGKESCKWLLNGGLLNLTIACTLGIPKSNNCEENKLEIDIANNKSQSYCGYYDLNLKSQGPTVTIVQSTLEDSEAEFYCAIDTVEPDQDCNCGNSKKRIQKRIVDGKISKDNGYPMMAAIYFVGLGDFACGAIIINNNFVLTLNECVRPDENNPVYNSKILVVVGDQHVETGDNNTPYENSYEINSVSVPPDYEKDKQSGNLALVKLASKITFGANLSPACLPFYHQDDSFDKYILTLLGYGLISTEAYGKSRASSINLREAQEQVVPLESCQRERNYGWLTAENICLNNRDNTGACALDQGGPILWQDPKTKKFVLIGVISLSTNCGNNEVYDVGIRIGSYLEWINDVVSDSQELCKAE